MILLAIDTSSAYASIALHDGRNVVAEETWLAERRHDDKLFPSIAALLALAGIAPTAIELIAVAIGPGSFTGVRIGIAAAQGLARGSGARVVGVGTLDVIAHPFATARTRVCALIPAGRGEHYAAMYRSRRGAFERVTSILVGTIDDLSRRVAVETLFAGEIDDAAASALRDRMGRRAIIPTPDVLTRRAGHLAELAWRRRESSLEPAAVEPLYVRPPAIRGPGGELVGDTRLAPVASALRSS